MTTVLPCLFEIVLMCIPSYLSSDIITCALKQTSLRFHCGHMVGGRSATIICLARGTSKLCLVLQVLMPQPALVTVLDTHMNFLPSMLTFACLLLEIIVEAGCAIFTDVAIKHLLTVLLSGLFSQCHENSGLTQSLG